MYRALSATEQLADMMAEKIGIDPLEFRYRNTSWPGTIIGCRKCGQTLVTEQLAQGKRHQVEQVLEDKYS